MNLMITIYNTLNVRSTRRLIVTTRTESLTYKLLFTMVYNLFIPLRRSTNDRLAMEHHEIRAMLLRFAAH